MCVCVEGVGAFNADFKLHHSLSYRLQKHLKSLFLPHLHLHKHKEPWPNEFFQQFLHPIWKKKQSYTETHEHMIYSRFAKCSLYSGKCSLAATALHFTAAAAPLHLQSSRPLFCSVSPRNIPSQIILSRPRLLPDTCQTPSLSSRCTFTKWDD